VIIEAIRRRAEAACPGPWQAYNGNEGTEYGPLWAVANNAYHNPPADEDAPWIAVHIETGTRDDMEFIAHARQDIPDLIAEIERLRDLLTKLTDPDPCDHFDHHGQCQAHMATYDGRCAHADAKKLLAETYPGSEVWE
jgi:hypothetical protein